MRIAGRRKNYSRAYRRCLRINQWAKRTDVLEANGNDFTTFNCQMSRKVIKPFQPLILSSTQLLLTPGMTPNLPVVMHDDVNIGLYLLCAQFNWHKFPREFLPLGKTFELRRCRLSDGPVSSFHRPAHRISCYYELYHL